MEVRDAMEVKEATYQNENMEEEISAGGDAVRFSVTWSFRKLEILKLVARKLASFTPRQVSDSSHRETAWKEAEDRELISYEKALLCPFHSIDVTFFAAVSQTESPLIAVSQYLSSI